MSKILIGENNDTFRHTLKNLLHSRFPAMDFEEARDGADAMQKTNDFVMLPVESLFGGKPHQLLQKYSDRISDKFFRPLSNQHMNRNLKVLASMAGIKKRPRLHSIATVQ